MDRLEKLDEILDSYDSRSEAENEKTGEKRERTAEEERELIETLYSDAGVTLNESTLKKYMSKAKNFLKTAAAATLLTVASSAFVMPGCSSRDDSTPQIEQTEPEDDPVADTENLELYELLSQHYGALTKDNWEQLQDFSVNTPYNFSNTTQSVAFQDLEPVWAKKDGNVADHLGCAQGGFLYTWSANFEDGLRSDVGFDDKLIDVVQQNFDICGNTYRVTDANVSSADPDKIFLGLMTGTASAPLSGMGDKTILVKDSTEYEVELVGTVDNGDGTYSARIKVNGQDLGLLDEGNLGFLADGEYVGIMMTGSQLAEVAIGAQKLNLMDSNMNDDSFDAHVSAWGSRGTVNWFEGAEARIKAAREQDGSVTINSLAYRLKAQDEDVLVPRQANLSDAVGAKTLFDITYDGLEDWSSSRIDLECSQASGGGFMYTLGFKNKEGIDTLLPLCYNNNGTLKWGGKPSGSALSNLVMQEATSETDYNVSLGDYFVLNGAQDFTHVLFYDSINTSNRTLKFWDTGTGSVEVTYDPATGRADLVRGGETFAVYVDTSGSQLAVDQNGDGALNGAEVEAVDYFGGRIGLESNDGTTAKAVLRTPASRIEGKSTDEHVGIKVDAVGSTDLSLNLGRDLRMVEDTSAYKGMSRAGVYGEEGKEALNPQATLYYPETQPFTGTTLKKTE